MSNIAIELFALCALLAVAAFGIILLVFQDTTTFRCIDERLAQIIMKIWPLG